MSKDLYLKGKALGEFSEPFYRNIGEDFARYILITYKELC